jgi:HPt (histidine-containing phosphotransfer) domain-containing protein
MPSDVDAEFFQRLAELNDKFAAALPRTLGRLLETRNAFDVEQPQQALIDGLDATLHTLAGSAATFGFRLLGQHARVLEQRLRVLTTFDAVAGREWEAWLAELDIFVAWALRDPKSAYPNDEFVV